MAQSQVSLWHSDNSFLLQTETDCVWVHREICGCSKGKLYKTMKSGMKQVSVLGFDLILRQDVATVSGNPLECHLASKMVKLIKRK